MRIKDMHFDFKKKINKVDSQKYRNLLIPEIDWALNEGAELFVKLIAEPRLRKHLGFEISQRSIDDIKSLVITDKEVDVENNVIQLPLDYMYYIRGRVKMTKDNCKDIIGKLYIKQHDDEFDFSVFDKSSFEWREVNGVFNKDGVKLYTEGFEVKTVLLSYIKKLGYMHNAEAYRADGYKLPSGTSLSGTFDCELPEHTHREIVDLAVLIITGELQIPDYQIKQAKISLNNLN